MHTSVLGRSQIPHLEHGPRGLRRVRLHPRTRIARHHPAHRRIKCGPPARRLLPPPQDRARLWIRATRLTRFPHARTGSAERSPQRRRRSPAHQAPALVADDARMHHLKQRFADLFGCNRSGVLLLFNDTEQLQVARRASARERTRGRSMRHHAHNDHCEHPWCRAEYPRHLILLGNRRYRAKSSAVRTVAAGRLTVRPLHGLLSPARFRVTRKR